MAQKGNGRRTQFRPAAAMSAKSRSVCSPVQRELGNKCAAARGRVGTHDELVIVLPEETLQPLLPREVGAERNVRPHELGQGPLVARGFGLVVEVAVKERRGDEWLEGEPAGRRGCDERSVSGSR